MLICVALIFFDHLLWDRNQRQADNLPKKNGKMRRKLKRNKNLKNDVKEKEMKRRICAERPGAALVSSLHR